MNPDRLTEKAQEAIVHGQRLAEERFHTQMEPEHLLAVLLDQAGGLVPTVLAKLGTNDAPLRRALE